MAKKNTTKNGSGSLPFLKPGDGAPATLLAEVEVPLETGPLAGLKVSGIRIWRRKDEPSHIFVTFPGRQYENGEGLTRTFEYIRATDGSGETVKAIREQILAAYREQQKEVNA